MSSADLPTPPEPYVAPESAGKQPPGALPFGPPQAYPPYPAPPPGWQAPYGGYAPYGPYVPPRPVEGLAIASLIISCFAVLALCGYGVGGLIGFVGVALGNAARRNIANNRTSGEGLAQAGVIVGYIAGGLGALSLLVIGAFIVMAVTATP